VDVVIIDDHPVFRVGLRMLLEASGAIRVVGEAGTVASAAATLAASPPQVAVLDLDLGGEDAVAAFPELQRAAPDARFLVLTGTRDADRHESALRAGVRGLVVKDLSADAIVNAILKVNEGELWFDRALVDAALRGIMRGRPATPERIPAASLTERERQIVDLVAAGLRNDDVARRLGISEKTVRNHLTIVFDKLGVSGRLELLVYAYQRGLVKLPP
jgi:DNA-binding NarL/FixJ family response regulator